MCFKCETTETAVFRAKEQFLVHLVIGDQVAALREINKCVSGYGPYFVNLADLLRILLLSQATPISVATLLIARSTVIVFHKAALRFYRLTSGFTSVELAYEIQRHSTDLADLENYGSIAGPTLAIATKLRRTVSPRVRARIRQILSNETHFERRLRTYRDKEGLLDVDWS